MQALSRRIYSFDHFQLDIWKRQLLHDGEPIMLQGKAFELLRVLVEHRGRVLEKEELYKQVWPDQIVEESNLTVHMSAVRKALGERASRPRYITTISGRGYRFVADVHELEDETEEIVVEHHTVARVIVESDISVTDEPQETPTTSHPSDVLDAHAPVFRPQDKGDQTTSDIPAQAAAALMPAVTISASSRARPKFYRMTAIIALTGLMVAAAGFAGSRYLRREETPAVVAPFQQMKLTRLTTEGKASKAIISPDGKYFVYVLAETNGQSLWIKQIAGSRSVQIVPPGSFFYWGLTFAPDGNHLYCTLFNNNKGSWLMRVPTLGGAVEQVDAQISTAVSFAPDGQRYAYAQSHKAQGLTFIEIAEAGKDKRILARRKQPDRFSTFDAASVAWSPDGEVITSIANNAEASGGYTTIVGLRVSDGQETRLTAQRWSSVGDIAWLPDGSGLLLTASDQPSMPKQVWLLSYPGGEARKITNDLHEYNSISVTADGKNVVTVQENAATGVWTMDGHSDTGSARQIASEAGNPGAVGWTPDGQIVYRSYASGSPDLWMMEADGTNPRQLTADAHAAEFKVSPDGRYIVFASERTGKRHLWRVRADGSDMRQLTDGVGEAFPNFTPDGQWVVYQHGVGAMKATFWKISITGGESVQLTDTHGVRLELSPDGQWLAYFYMDDAEGPTQWRLGVMPSAGGEPVQSFKLPDTVLYRIVRWTPDGQALIYISTVGGAGNLWRQPLDGSPPEKLTDFDKERIENFACAADSNRIILTRRTQLSDVALLRDFR